MRWIQLKAFCVSLFLHLVSNSSLETNLYLTRLSWIFMDRMNLSSVFTGSAVAGLQQHMLWILGVPKGWTLGLLLTFHPLVPPHKRNHSISHYDEISLEPFAFYSLWVFRRTLSQETDCYQICKARHHLAPNQSYLCNFIMSLFAIQIDLEHRHIDNKTHTHTYANTCTQHTVGVDTLFKSQSAELNAITHKSYACVRYVTQSFA